MGTRVRERVQQRARICVRTLTVRPSARSNLCAIHVDACICLCRRRAAEGGEGDSAREWAIESDGLGACA